MKELDEILTIDEIAKFLKLKKRSIYKLIGEGKLKKINLPGRRLIRIKKQSFLKFIGELHENPKRN